MLSEAERQALLYEGIERKDRPVVYVKASDATMTKVPGDGDCLYWSLCEGFEGADGQWGRKRALEWLVEVCAREDALSKKMRDAIKAETRETVQQYVARMRPRLLGSKTKGASNWGGEDGGYVELSAWATLVQREVWVWRLDGKLRYRCTTCFEPLDGSDTEGKKPICVVYSGNHYDILKLSDPALRKLL